MPNGTTVSGFPNLSALRGTFGDKQDSQHSSGRSMALEQSVSFAGAVAWMLKLMTKGTGSQLPNERPRRLEHRTTTDQTRPVQRAFSSIKPDNCADFGPSRCQLALGVFHRDRRLRPPHLKNRTAPVGAKSVGCDRPPRRAYRASGFGDPLTLSGP